MQVQIHLITWIWLTSSVKNHFAVQTRSPCHKSSKNYCLKPANNSSSKLVTTLVDCHRPCRDLGNPGKTQNKPRALPDNPRSRQKRISTGTEEHCPGDEGKESEHRKQEHKTLVFIIRNRGSTKEAHLGTWKQDTETRRRGRSTATGCWLRGSVGNAPNSTGGGVPTAAQH